GGKVRRAEPLDWARGVKGGPDPSQEYDRMALGERLKAAMAPLPARQREVLLLHDLAGGKHREIGVALGMKEGTVRYTLFQARRAVRERLDERTPATEERDA